MKDTCVFEGCKKLTTNGVCDEHTIDAVAVVRGEEPRCPHDRLWSEDCRDCQRESAGRALFDGNVAAMLTRGGIDGLSTTLKMHDGVLRFLQVELTRIDVPSTLGPNGGVPIATHLGVSAADGRMCRVDVDSAKVAVDGGGLVTMSVHWGDRELLTAGGATAEVVGALVTYFIGVKERAKVLR